MHSSGLFYCPKSASIRYSSLRKQMACFGDSMRLNEKKWTGWIGVVLIIVIAGSTRITAHPIINEIMATSSSQVSYAQGHTGDWIEIANTGRTVIDLAGMYLTDDPSNSKKWQFPRDNLSLTALIPGGFVVVWLANDTKDTGLHAQFNLDGDGEGVQLYDRDSQTLLDQVWFGRQRMDISYGRHPDQRDQWAYLTTPTPGSNNAEAYLGVVSDTRFSFDRGFYDRSFDVIIATDTPGATITYTVDASNPLDDHNRRGGPGKQYTAPIRISTTTCLRAIATKPGWLATNVDTHTYVFPTDVIGYNQGQALAAGYPNEWSGFPGDYGMDTEITKHPEYAPLMRDALLSIPTVSLVTDKIHLFDPAQGIYMNTTRKGPGWERPVSAELFGSHIDNELQIDCGLRLQGGAARQPYKCPKHSFSLRFRSLYGKSKLTYPLFEGSPVDQFDSIHLRGMFNNAWTHWDAGQRARAQMIRDQWVRDTLRDMGEPSAGRGFYVHLYLNGMYWGLYNLHERADATHYGAYYDTDPELIDAYNATALKDGTRTAYTEMKSIVVGRDWTRIQDVLAVDNYIDWYLIQHFGHNDDLKDNGNWRCAGGGPLRMPWRFYGWDSERVLELRTLNNTGRLAKSQDPPGLIAQLDDIDGFRIRFADRLHKHLFNQGALTPAANQERWIKRAHEIDLAIVAESARWGDYRRDVHAYSSGPYELYTKNTHWLAQQQRLLNEYFPQRTNKMIQKYRNEGLYPAVDAPVLHVNNAYQHGGHIAATDRLSFASANGTVWYTLDGTDPIEELGSRITSTALRYTDPFHLGVSGPVKARTLENDQFSALNEALFVVGALTESLRITEIMYHPVDPNAEFIELTNISDESVNLSRIQFTRGISFTFPTMELAANERVVVVQDTDAFKRLYRDPIPIAGQYTGSLSNGGERITLSDALGIPVQDVTYQDTWYKNTDGQGFSLTVNTPLLTDPHAWSDRGVWQASSIAGGTPGQ
jgi:hypothetical protein